MVGRFRLYSIIAGVMSLLLACADRTIRQPLPVAPIMAAPVAQVCMPDTAAQQQPEPRKKHALIVLVHGTIVPWPYTAGILSLIERLSQKARFIRYCHESSIKAIRFTTVYGNQAVGAYGLYGIRSPLVDQGNLSPASYRLAVGLRTAWDIARPDYYEKFHCYTFGWPGLLSIKSRREGGELLHKTLAKEVQELIQQHSLEPEDLEVFVFGHSHGGNVALQMASVHNAHEHGFSVQSLMLFGTPIQRETEEYARCPLFKKIVSVYSPEDMVQVMDIFSAAGFWPGRRFSQAYLATAQEGKIHQVAVRVDGISPSHAELWFFRDALGALYRSRLSIAPLPVVLFAPFIIETLRPIDSSQHNLTLSLVAKRNAYYMSFENFEGISIDTHHACIEKAPLEKLWPIR